jgi:hypothetical protein
VPAVKKTAQKGSKINLSPVGKIVTLRGFDHLCWLLSHPPVFLGFFAEISIRESSFSPKVGSVYFSNTQGDHLKDIFGKYSFNKQPNTSRSHFLAIDK